MSLSAACSLSLSSSPPPPFHSPPIFLPPLPHSPSPLPSPHSLPSLPFSFPFSSFLLLSPTLPSCPLSSPPSPPRPALRPPDAQAKKQAARPRRRRGRHAGGTHPQIRQGAVRVRQTDPFKVKDTHAPDLVSPELSNSGRVGGAASVLCAIPVACTCS